MLVALCMMYVCTAQGRNYSGKVTDAKHLPVAAVTVVLADVKGVPIDFCKTDSAGRFALADKDGRQAAKLVFTAIGYKRTSLAADKFDNGRNVELQSQQFVLREVKVRPQKIRRRGDTLTYSVSGFRQKQDRTIAEVIARMPGLEVKPNGTIEYQGKSINRFYVEGMDLLGSKYSQASENLSADNVRSVEVMENHQPVGALRGVRFSDQAALNIVLKEDAKNVWNGTADIAAGTELQHKASLLRDVRLTEMLFARRKQSISMYKTNNTGKDIEHELADQSGAGGYVPVESGLLRNISWAAPQLDRRRHTMNDTHIAATNWLFKTAGNNDLRLQLTALADHTDHSQYLSTTYIDVAGGPTLVEVSDGESRRNEWNAELTYRVNSDRKYVSNRLVGHVDFNKSVGTTLAGGTAISRMVKPRSRYVADDFECIRKIGGTRSVSFATSAAYSYLPGTLLLADGATEHLRFETMTWSGSTSFRHKIAGFYVTYQGGAELKNQRMTVDNPLSVTASRYGECRIYITPQVSYETRSMRLSAQLKTSWTGRTYREQESGSIDVEPVVFARYTITPTLNVTAGYSTGVNTMGIVAINDSRVFADYNMLSSGSGQLDRTRYHTASAAFDMKDVVRGLFANCRFNYIATTGSRLYQATMNGNVYERRATGEFASTHSYNVSGGAQKVWGMAGVSLGMKGFYGITDYTVLMAGGRCPYRMYSAGTTLTLNYRPWRLLSVDASSLYSYSKQQSRASQQAASEPLRSFVHKLSAYFMPGNWQVECTSELYHSNDKSVSTAMFTDISVSYRTRRYELSAQCSNLFGSSLYERRMLTAARHIYTQNTLRKREIMAKVSFNF